MKSNIPEQVKRGSQLLDQHIPNWFELIDTEMLDLNSPFHCILGQLSVHAEAIPMPVRKHMRTTSHRAFTRTLHALERVSKLDIDLYEYAFIEEASWDGSKLLMHTNRAGWIKAIADRKQAVLDRRPELDNTPLAKQVRAGIDAELKALLADREYELVA